VVRLPLHTRFGKASLVFLSRRDLDGAISGAPSDLPIGFCLATSIYTGSELHYQNDLVHYVCIRRAISIRLSRHGSNRSAGISFTKRFKRLDTQLGVA